MATARHPQVSVLEGGDFGSEKFLAAWRECQPSRRQCSFHLSDRRQKEDSLHLFSSVQDGIYALGKAHRCFTPFLRRFANVTFETVPLFVWLRMALSRPSKKIISSFNLFPCLSPPGDWWCDVRGFVPAGSASSFSTLQIFREASHLWGLLCPLVYLLCHFPSLRHVQGSTPTGVFEDGCRPSTHSSLGFPFPSSPPP